MAEELPYLPSYKNVATLFKKIETAAVPDSFTYKFLENTIGLKGSADRSLITLLKSLGFLDPSSKPLPTYNMLKNKQTAGKTIAAGVRTAYAPLFKANEKANELEREDLKGLVSQVAGSDTPTTTKIVGTFLAVKGVADFTGESEDESSEDDDNSNDQDQGDADNDDKKRKRSSGGMRPEFHYNLQIQLPANGSEETYIRIFNAMRKVFE